MQYSKLLILLASILAWSCNTPRYASLVTSDKKEEKVYDLKTRMDLAMQQEVEKTKDPELGYVPRERLNDAIAYTRMLQGGKLHKAAIPSITWNELGPANVGGRTRALMFDPNDATYKRVFAAGVAGGLWVTDNIYADEPKWEKVNDFFDNMAITCFAYDPQRPDTMYFGTGEGYFNSDAVRGDGIYRSTDGGSTWSRISNSGVDTFYYIQKMVVASNGNVFASTRDQGVIKSTTSGATWTRVLGSGLTASTNRANDLDIDASGNIYATMGIFNADGIYKSTNNGSSWTKVSSGTGFPTSGFYRIEVACAPTDANYVYATLDDASTHNCLGIYQSTDGGSTWTSKTVPVSGVDSKNFGSGQAWYNFTVVVDPKDKNTVIIGGLDLYRTTNGGTSWTQLSHWYGGGGFPEVHADQHVTYYRPGSSDTVLFGNDGGVYLATGMSSTPVFKEKEADYNTTQFYSCAIHPFRNRSNFLAGAQDNGSQQFTAAGIGNTLEVSGGDGGFVHIDQNDPKYQYTSYIYNNFYRSADSGQTFSSISVSSTGKFINPSDYDNATGNLYSSYTSGYYLLWTNAKTTTSFSTVNAGFSGQVSAVTVDPNTSNRVWFGTDNGNVYAVDNAASSPSVSHKTSTFPSGWPGGYITCIAIEQGNANHILVTFSNYGVNSVWESTNGGTSWANVEGNLPDMPVRWAMFSPLGADSALLATELGVWSTTNLNGSSTDWQPTNTGLANIRTDMLQVRWSDSAIIAATHGRGLYITKSFSKTVQAEFAVSDSIVYPGEYVTFYDNSYGATSWAWDMDNDGITDTTGNTVSWAWFNGGYKTVKLTINGSKNTTMVIHVLPRLGTPYAVSDGGNFETNPWHFGGRAITGGVNLWERGTPTNALTTLNSSSNGWKTDLDADILEGEYACGLYTPSFNMAASGTYTFTFRKSMEVTFCNAPFAVQVQYSTDGGLIWNRLGDYGSGTNWYNRGSATCGTCCIVSSIFSDRTGWTTTVNNQNTSYDVSFLAGNKDVRFRFILKVVSGYSASGYQVDGFMVDDFSLSGPTNAAVPYDVETEICSKTLALGANDSAYYYSPNGKLMAVLRNLSSHNFGNTTVTIDEAGSTPKNFDTQTDAARRRLAKSIKITPTTNNTGAKVEIQLFYDKTAETDNWQTTTSHYYKNLQLFKSPNPIGSATIANSVYGDSTIVDSAYGSNAVRVVARFNNGFSGVGAGGGGNNSLGPLPVTWLSFTGKRQAGETQLYFATAQEINNSHFEIERCVPGNNFISLGSVAGKGNYSGISHYHFTDNDEITGSSVPLIYRIKQVDFDGKYNYSSLLLLQNKLDVGAAFKLYPQPANDELNITTDFIYPNTKILVYDAQGKLVKSEPIKQTYHQLLIADLPEQTYLVIITDGRTVFHTSRMVKLKK